MADLFLYQTYTRDEVIPLFAPRTTLREESGGQWVILPDAVLCFTTLEIASGTAYFPNASSFHWINGSRDPDALPDIPSIPPEVDRGYKPAPQVWLFVRRDTTEPYICLGNLGPCRGGTAKRGGLAWRSFELRPPLPPDIYADIVNPNDEFGQEEALTLALSELPAVISASERFSILKLAVEYFYGPVEQEEALSKSELKGLEMPDVLRWWYRWIGKRSQLMVGPNRILRPDELIITHDHQLVFYGDEHGVMGWATELEGEDPPVCIKPDEFDPIWHRESLRLSEHLILACLYDIAKALPYSVVGLINEQELTILSELFPPIPRLQWRHIGIHAHYREGTVMIVSKQEYEQYNITIGSWTDHFRALIQGHIPTSSIVLS